MFPFKPNGLRSCMRMLASIAMLATSAAFAAAAPASDADGAGIAWFKGDVDAAFATAKNQNKPVFLYWGAVWCPPCNQVKATIFNRNDFIERSRFFVPVYLDGDSKSAQKLGARFKVSGYPTMILFTPDGREITRLPGEVDADQYMRVLAMGMGGARPIKELVAAGLSPNPKLSTDEWRMLAWYSWLTDDAQALAKPQVAPTLQRLAQACPASLPETAARLRLQSIALAGADAAKAKRNEPNPALSGELSRLLADRRFVRDNADLIVYYGADAVRAATAAKSPQRAKLVGEWIAALAQLAADSNLSTGDRLNALDAQIDLARIDDPKATLPTSLVAAVREQAARADRETTDPYARQALISTAAGLLADAGLASESDALLTRELERSQSPYYYMLGLAANAKKRGDRVAALTWYEKAYAAADGPATRLQWGASYVNALIELSPDDSARIDAAVKSVLAELEPEPETFYGRNQRALEKMGTRLVAWDKGGAHRHDASLQRYRAQLAAVCGKLPSGDAARQNCDRLANPAARVATAGA
jgi:thioredoxin-related protein